MHTLLVVTTSDPEQVTLEFITEGVTKDLLTVINQRPIVPKSRGARATKN